MKPWFRLFILSVVLVTGALARATDTIEMYNDSTGNTMEMPLILKADCVSQLKGLFSPEAVIQKGLGALNGLNNSGGEKIELGACLAQMIDEGAAMSSNIDPYASYDGDDDSSSSSKTEDLDSVTKYDPAKAGGLSEQQWDEKVANLYDPADGLGRLLYKIGDLDRLERTELDTKMECYSEYEKGSEDHKWLEEDRPHCKGKWISKKEYTKLENRRKELDNELEIRETEYNKNRDALNIELYKAFLDPKFDLPKMKEELDKLHCYNPYVKGSADYDYHESSYEQCKDKWLSKKQAEGVANGIKAKFSALQASIKKKTEELKKKEAEKVKKQYAEYSFYRLIAAYRGFLKKGGNADDYNKFCTSYEQDQRRDQKFAKSGHTVQMFSSEKQWKFAQEHSLTEGELSAIINYSGSGYGDINSALRKKSMTSQNQAYKETLDAGLEKLPAYTEKPVVRFADVPDDEVRQHKKGAIVTYSAYTSTSKKDNWSWGGSESFKIYVGKNGKLIEEISNYEQEEEVLFKSGTKFKVLERKSTGDGTTFILAETDANGKVIAKVPEKLTFIGESDEAKSNTESGTNSYGDDEDTNGSSSSANETIKNEQPKKPAYKSKKKKKYYNYKTKKKSKKK